MATPPRRLPNELFIPIFTELKSQGAEATLAELSLVSKALNELADSVLLRELTITPRKPVKSWLLLLQCKDKGRLRWIRRLHVELPDERAVGMGLPEESTDSQGSAKAWAKLLLGLLGSCVRLSELSVSIENVGFYGELLGTVECLPRTLRAISLHYDLARTTGDNEGPEATSETNLLALLEPRIKDIGDTFQHFEFAGPLAHLFACPSLIPKTKHLALCSDPSEELEAAFPVMPSLRSVEIMHHDPHTTERLVPVLHSRAPGLQELSITSNGMPDLVLSHTIPDLGLAFLDTTTNEPAPFASVLSKLTRLSFGTFSASASTTSAARNLSRTLRSPSFNPKEIEISMLAFAHQEMNLEWTTARNDLWKLESINKLIVTHPYEGGLASMFEDKLPPKLQEVVLCSVRSEQLKSLTRQISLLLFYYRNSGNMPFDEKKCRLTIVEVGADGKEKVWVWKPSAYRFRCLA